MQILSQISAMQSKLQHLDRDFDEANKKKFSWKKNKGE